MSLKIDYREQQRVLNEKWISRVEEWLTHFGISYAGKVIHIIDGPPESILPHRPGRVSTRARFLGIGAKIDFSLGAQRGECPSFSPSSMKATQRVEEHTKKKGMHTLIFRESQYKENQAEENI